MAGGAAMTAFTDLVLSAPRRQLLPVATFPGARLVGRSIAAMATDPAAQAEASAALRDRLGLAFSQSAMDLSVEAEAFGAQVRMVDDEVPTVLGRLVTDVAGIRALRVPDAGARRTAVPVETVRRLAREPGGRFVVGGCIGPFTLAGRLFGVSESLEYAMEEPEALEELVAKTTEFLIAHVRAFRAAGARAVFMAEPTAGLLSPAMLGRFSSPFVKRIVDACEGDGFGLILHNCGARLAHLPQVLASGASAFHFGQPMDLAAAARQVPAGVVVCGNLDPAGAFVGLTPDVLAERTAALARSVAGRRNVVLSSGCDLPPDTPLANLEAWVTAASAS